MRVYTPYPRGRRIGRRLRLGNIKGFGFTGPLRFDVAVVRDAAQATADATIGMSFTGDRKLTRVVPSR